MNIEENFVNDLEIKFNSLKTNYVVINTHTNNNTTLKINGVEIEEVKTIKYLGTANSNNNDQIMIHAMIIHQTHLQQYNYTKITADQLFQMYHNLIYRMKKHYSNWYMRLDSTYEMINKKKYKMDIIMLHFVVSSNEEQQLQLLHGPNYMLNDTNKAKAI